MIRILTPKITKKLFLPIIFTIPQTIFPGQCYIIQPMSKQVVVIHGGDSYNTHKEYIEHLKSCEVLIDKFKRHRDWKSTLQEELGGFFEVLLPQMPNSSNARFSEWKIWFERILPFLQDNVILIGHSLGGIFLAKYLSENNIPKKIKALILVAAPHNQTVNVGDFQLPGSLNKIIKQCPQIFLYHSKDDPVVTFSEMEAYLKQLPKAKSFVFDDRGHFLQENFPEIIALLQTKWLN